MRSESRRRRNACALAAVCLAWLVFDIATKRFFDSGSFDLGEHIAGPFLGLFRFTLVHNTGAAWGMFSDATFVLGVFSIIICLIVIGYALYDAAAPIGVAVGAGLVVAGGIGNAIDRFANGYVIDFIDFTFIDFPVFNIADIGVTCGLIVIVASTIFAWSKEGR